MKWCMWRLHQDAKEKESSSVHPREASLSFTCSACDVWYVHTYVYTTETAQSTQVHASQSPWYKPQASPGIHQEPCVALLGRRLGNRFKRGFGKKKHPESVYTIHQII